MGPGLVGCAGAVASARHLRHGRSPTSDMARRTLEKADAARFAKAILKTNQWFLVTPARASLLDAAAALPGLCPGRVRLAQRSLDFILAATIELTGGMGTASLDTRLKPFDTGGSSTCAARVERTEANRWPLSPRPGLPHGAPAAGPADGRKPRGRPAHRVTLNTFDFRMGNPWR